MPSDKTSVLTRLRALILTLIHFAHSVSLTAVLFPGDPVLFGIQESIGPPEQTEGEDAHRSDRLRETPAPQSRRSCPPPDQMGLRAQAINSFAFL